MDEFLELADFRRRYAQRVPRMFQDYCEAGSWSQQTRDANITDLQAVRFRQRVARDIETLELDSQLVGQQVKMPLALAPVGMLGMQHPDGEIHSARAAEAFGVPFTLSTMSICSLESVAARTQAPFWFQLYVQKDREFTLGLIKRAKAVGCSALVLTLDLQVLGKRHADHRNGLRAPPHLTAKNLIDIARRPKWALGMLRTENRQFGNIQGCVAGVDDMHDLMKWTAGSFDRKLDWSDIQFYRDAWDGPLIIKGIMEVEDAKACVALGADALVVSNHGGRQLDGAQSSIRVLPEIAATVGDQIEVWMDSGIRSGQDLIRATALGAKGVMIGRPFVYALGAAGEAGVKRMLEIFHEEASLTMAFMGHKRIQSVTQNDVIIPNWSQ